MKGLQGHASNVVNDPPPAEDFASVARGLQDLPPQAFGDPKAAAEFGKELAKAAGASQKAEAESASSSFESLQRTYQKLAEEADTAEERDRIREDVRRSEERADHAAKRRSESNERIWMSGLKVAGVVAVGIAGLTLATTAYALSRK